MKQVADGVFLLQAFPPNAINVYLAGDVLIDAGMRGRAKGILRALRGVNVSAHALTHAHPDHQGASRVVVDGLGIPLWCGAGEADSVERGDLSPCMLDSALSRFALRWFAGPACPVSRRLFQGDEVGGFQVLDCPGHSPGHIAYWRESERTLIIGDVLANMNLVTGFPGLHEPPTFFTVDPALNRTSARRLAALEPDIVLFGHGPPWKRSTATRPFSEKVSKLLSKYP